MNRPPVAFERVMGFLAGLQVETCEPELLAARRLQIEPDRFAVEAPPFMPGDLHVHRALMHQALLRAVGANGPDAIDLVPRAFVTIEQKIRIGRRELKMIEP